MEGGFYFAFGAAIIMALLPFVTPVPKVVAWAGTLAGLAIMLAEFLPAEYRPSLAAVALFVIGAMALAGSGYLYFHREKVSSGHGFYMECNQQFGPMKISSVGLYFVQINETGGGGLSHLPIADPSQEGQEYRILNDKIIETLQCKLSNYEALPALGTTLNLTILFRKVVRSGILVSEGEVVGQRTISLPFGQYGKIDPGAADSFTFYIANRSEISGISVVFPKTITARLLNEEKARSFPLKSGPTIFLLPERPLPPLPPSPSTLTEAVAPQGQGGRGGSGEIFGNNGTIIGGKGGNVGPGGVGRGGDGGGGVIHGDGGTIIGGEGGSVDGTNIWFPPAQSGYIQHLESQGQTPDFDVQYPGAAGASAGWLQRQQIVEKIREEYFKKNGQEAKIRSSKIRDVPLEYINEKLKESGYSWRARIEKKYWYLYYIPGVR